MFGLQSGWGVPLSLKFGITVETAVAVWTFALSIRTSVHGLRPPEACFWSFLEIGANTSSRKEAALIHPSFAGQLTWTMPLQHKTQSEPYTKSFDIPPLPE
jgi:hypothetical protein